MKIKSYLVAVSLMSTLFAVLPVYANAFRMMEGDLLRYEYERIDFNGGGQTGNVASTIPSLSPTNGYSTS